MANDEQSAAEFLMTTIMSAWLGPALWVAVRLGLADKIARGPLSALVLAQQTGTDPAFLRRLLNALASIGVFKRVATGEYGLTAISTFMRSDHPSKLSALIDTGLGGENWEAWLALEEAVRTGRCGFDIRHGMNWLEYLDQHQDRRETFAAAMTATTRATEEAVLDAHDFGRFERAVDVGGSHGSMIGALLMRHPAARGVVFDLPTTVEAGRSAWRGSPFAERLEAAGGDFFASVPEGDLYLLKLILHDWQDPKVLEILKTIRKSVRRGGRVAIIETILPDDGAPHMGWALDMAMMVTTGGRERSRSEHEQLLKAAGFQPTTLTPTPAPYSVLEAVAA